MHLAGFDAIEESLEGWPGDGSVTVPFVVEPLGDGIPAARPGELDAEVALELARRQGDVLTTAHDRLARVDRAAGESEAGPVSRQEGDVTAKCAASTAAGSALGMCDVFAMGSSKSKAAGGTGTVLRAAIDGVAYLPCVMETRVHERKWDEEDTGESAEAHAGFHLSVEMQLLTSNPPDVADVLEKLVASGSTRHEGIHAIGRLLARQLFSLTKGEQEEFDMPRYQRELRELLPKSSASSKVLPFRGDAPRTAAPRPWRPSSRKRRR